MNEANYRNQRMLNQKYQNQYMKSSNMFMNIFMFIFAFGWWKSLFNHLPSENNYGSKGMRDVRKSYSFSCKPKSTNCAIKQYAQMKKDHSHLWTEPILEEVK